MTSSATISEAKLLQILHSKTFKTVFKNFEKRPSQEEMIRDVTFAFNEKRLYLVEADTGIGKSLAYLLPAIQWIIEHREKVVISTHTIHLQEQLVHKDLPMVMRSLNVTNLKVALVKGRNNYLCTRKYTELDTNQLTFTDIKKKPLETKNDERFHKWAQQTTTGDFSQLPFIVHGREKICNEGRYL